VAVTVEVNKQPSAPATFAGSKRLWARVRFVVGTFLCFYILVVVNIITFRHPVRFDFTAERVHSLSQATLDKLELVQQEILVVYPQFVQPGNNVNVAELRVLDRTRLLLSEYMARQPLIKMAAEVDVFGDPERWVQILDEFDLEKSQVNRFIFFTGKDQSFSQTVTPRDLARFGTPADPVMDIPEIKGYRGERAITDAITRLIGQERRNVYLVQDKGGPTLVPQASQAQGPGGLNALVHELATEGMDVRPLSLGLVKQIPDDCALLVIAGSFQPYSPDEIRVVDRYLHGGGRLLVTLGPRRTGIEDLLEDWRVKVLDDKVQGQISFPGRKIATFDVPARAFNKLHPITKVFVNVPRFEFTLDRPRPLEPGRMGKGLETTGILEVRSADKESYYLVPDDRTKALPPPGNFTVGMVVTQEVPARPPPGFQRLDTRILVIAATSFLTDQSFRRASHRDLLMNGVAWLLGEEEKATVSGSEWATRTLPTDPAISSFLFWVPIFLLPGLFLAVGAFLSFLRRT
jgi:hypothetical protein